MSTEQARNDAASVVHRVVSQFSEHLSTRAELAIVDALISFESLGDDERRQTALAAVRDLLIERIHDEGRQPVRVEFMSEDEWRDSDYGDVVDAVLNVYAPRIVADRATRQSGFDGYPQCPHGSCPTPYRCSERGDCPATVAGRDVVFVETFYALKRAWDMTIAALDILALADDDQTGNRAAFELAVASHGPFSQEAMSARAELHPERALARVIARTARAMLPENMPSEA